MSSDLSHSCVKELGKLCSLGEFSLAVPLCLASFYLPIVENSQHFLANNSHCESRLNSRVA